MVRGPVAGLWLSGWGHLRRIHYQVVSQNPAVLLPNGLPFLLDSETPMRDNAPENPSSYYLTSYQPFSVSAHHHHW